MYPKGNFPSKTVYILQQHNPPDRVKPRHELHNFKRMRRTENEERMEQKRNARRHIVAKQVENLCVKNEIILKLILRK